MNNIKIYRIIFPNGKIYIGQTCQSLERRWRKGEGYKKCPYVYCAIQKYGWENTTHELIVDGLTQEQADELERELIAKYKAQDSKYGYNIQNGGGFSPRGLKNTDTHNIAIAKAKSVPVVCYDTKGNYIATFSSAKEAAKITKTLPQEISKVRNGKSKTAGGYVWRFIGDPFDKYQHTPFPNARCKTIMLTTTDGVKIYQNASEAERDTGIAHSQILKYCKGETRPRNKYKWEFAG